MKNWETLREELLKNQKVAEEYKKLEPYYSLISQIIDARLKKGLTQKELAQKIGSQQSAIARLESGNSNPSLAFLSKVTKGLGAKMEIQIK